MAQMRQIKSSELKPGDTVEYAHVIVDSDIEGVTFISCIVEPPSEHGA